MSKDPAFLLYSSDFLTGISDLTMEERGQYITLLCLQHQKGHLNKKIIEISTPGISEDVLSKFKIDSDGKYFNSRLDNENEKREKHTPYKIASATLGGLISSKKLNKKQVRFIKSQFNIELFKHLDKENIKKEVSIWLSKCLTIYEDRNEDENRDVIKDEKEKEAGSEIIIEMPFPKPEFQQVWEYWKLFRKENNWRMYVPRGELAALTRLKRISDNNMQKACKIIMQSIENSYQGLFELKKDGKNEQISDQDIDKYFQNKEPA